MIRIPHPLGTLAFLSAWCVPWRPAFRAQARESGLSFYVHHRDLLGRHLAKYGGHEPLLTRLMSEYLTNTSRGIVVDVGANIGWHAIHAAQHKSVATVAAFEPDPFNAWLLDRNLSLNNTDNVVVSACAVGARRGSARLYRYKGSNRGRHSVLGNLGFGSRMVPMIDLDAALDNLGLGDEPVLLIKVDVEGYEPEVVAGAQRTLARTDMVIMEYSPGMSRRGGLSPETMLDQLCSAGLVPHRLEDRDWAAVEAASGNLAAENSAFEGQMDLVWIRPGSKKPFAGTASGNLLVPTDKAKLLQITEIWRRMAHPIAA
jgi:FkbM family methyltransferase